MIAVARRMLPQIVTQYVAGGLGNQLFDYAAARTLADRHSADLIIDPSILLTSNSRPFCLDAFAIRGRVRSTVDSVQRTIASRALRRFREDFLSMRVARKQIDCGYFAEFERLPGRCRITSHLLSPMFFRNNHQRIRSDIQVVDAEIHTSPRVRAAMPRVSRADSVVVHIRRGDMLRPENRHLQIEGLESYIADAMSKAERALKSVEFQVFSDDPEWCRTAKLFRGRKVNIISGHSESRRAVLEDFVLMSACPHIIMPNSGFSWWAAFSRREVGYTFLPPQWTPSNQVTIEEMRLPEWTAP